MEWLHSAAAARGGKGLWMLSPGDAVVLASGICLIIAAIFKYGGKKDSTSLDEIKRVLDALHDMHNVRDEDGVLKWHNKSGLEQAIKSLAENVSLQTQVFAELITQLKGKGD